jgi:protein-S-isoprenylcysteine O-methyltransferase Ste14
MSAHKKSFYNTSDFILYSLLAISFVIEYIFPTHMDIPLRVLIGISFLILGWLCVFFAKHEFKKYKQKTQPGHEISELITTGIFQYSRNPTYVGVVCVLIGIGFIANSFWVVLSVFPAIYVLTTRLIIQEEIYMQHVFKEKAVEYFKKVRRWL